MSCHSARIPCYYHEVRENFVERAYDVCDWFAEHVENKKPRQPSPVPVTNWNEHTVYRENTLKRSHTLDAALRSPFSTRDAFDCVNHFMCDNLVLHAETQCEECEWALGKHPGSQANLDDKKAERDASATYLAQPQEYRYNPKLQNAAYAAQPSEHRNTANRPPSGSNINRSDTSAYPEQLQGYQYNPQIKTTVYLEPPPGYSQNVQNIVYPRQTQEYHYNPNHLKTKNQQPHSGSGPGVSTDAFGTPQAPRIVLPQMNTPGLLDVYNRVFGYPTYSTDEPQ